MITRNIEILLKQLPKGVQLVAATKARTASQVEEAISAGITIVGGKLRKRGGK